MNKKNLVIIGGGGAGLFCGATVKQLSKNYEVYMISNEELFCRCSSPYVITKKAEMNDTIMPEQMITQFGIILLKGEVNEINAKTKIISYADNKTIKYDSLMFATGARPFLPKIEGIGLENVHSVRTPQDIKNINTKTSKIKKAVVIGGGVIGVEMAAALKERKVDVTMLIMETKPFANIADEEFSDAILENLTKNGVNVISNSVMTKINGNSKAEEVEYSIYNKNYSIKTDS